MSKFSPAPMNQLPWTGERLVPGVDGDSKLEHLHRYAMACDLAANLDVLDIASGEGYGTHLLSKVAKNVLGVDNSPEAIDHANSRYRADNLRFEVGLCQAIPLPDASVDLVVSFETIQQILDQGKFFTEVKRVLRPGGRFLLSSPNKAVQNQEQTRERAFHLRELYFQELEAMVTQEFAHRFWLAQRVCYGSIAYGFDGDGSPKLHSYDGDFDHVRSRKDLTPAPSFLVLCSDAPLDVVPNSIFENKAALERLRNQAITIKQPLDLHIKELEQRISRMECSTWWRLRKPLKFVADIILRRPPTGLFTPVRPAKKVSGRPQTSISPALHKQASLAGSGLRVNGAVAHSSAHVNRPISVIVPIYNNFDELQFCLASLLNYTSRKHPIVLIDDCSTDIRIWPMLSRLAAVYGQIKLHRHTSNLGYSATVNEGFRLTQGDLAVVHGNVRVSKRWLQKLSQCASRWPGIATVSPLMNSPGLFELPYRAAEGGLPLSVSVSDIAEIVEANCPRTQPRVPLANGACFYLRRQVLERVGAFDEKNFPNGYGEDADFSIRASEAGFIHLIDDSTFVFQKRSAAHRERRSPLVALAREKLVELHPTAPGKITEWLSHDPLLKSRKIIRNVIAARVERLHKTYRKASRLRKKNSILYIVQDGSGGTVLTTEDLIKSVAQVHTAYLLRTSYQQWSFYRCDENEFHLLQRFQFEHAWTIDAELNPEREKALDQLFSQFHFGVCHIRHLLGTSPEVIRKLKQYASAVVFSFHDFYTICPNIQLFNNLQTFCGGRCGAPEADPALGPETAERAGTTATVAKNSACSDCRAPSVWPIDALSQPLKHHYVYEWRTRARKALELCDGFVTTSQFASEIFLQHFEFLRKKDFRTIEHGRDFSKFRHVGTAPTGKTVRIIYFGSLQQHKGAELLAEIMRLDKGASKRFEFHLLGTIPRNGDDPRRLGAIYHGRYKRENLIELVEEIEPSFAIIPSIWPETFCHTLTEAWAMGLPVFASDIGTLRERILNDGGGWLIDHRSAAQWYETMLAKSHDPAEYDRQLQNIRQRALKNVPQMAAEYLDLYDSVIENRIQGV